MTEGSERALCGPVHQGTNLFRRVPSSWPDHLLKTHLQIPSRYRLSMDFGGTQTSSPNTSIQLLSFPLCLCAAVCGFLAYTLLSYLDSTLQSSWLNFILKILAWGLSLTFKVAYLCEGNFCLYFENLAQMSLPPEDFPCTSRLGQDSQLHHCIVPCMSSLFPYHNCLSIIYWAMCLVSNSHCRLSTPLRACAMTVSFTSLSPGLSKVLDL